MSDTGRGEPDAAGGRNYGAVGGSFSAGLPGMDQAKTQVIQLNASLTNLNQTMAKIQSSAAGFTNAVANITKSISGLSASTGTGTTTYGRGGGNGGIMGLGSSLFGPAGTGLAHDLALFPARFINNQVSNNRNVVNAAGGVLGMQSFGSNTNLQQMLGALSQQLGGVMGGNPADLLSLMSIGKQVGAGVDWRFYNHGMGPQALNNQPRAAGFLESVRQGQLMNPGADVSSIAGTVGGFIANTSSQQQGAFLTGGAFSMIGSGNKAKSISEWSESILKWFMNQRPGAKRGKPFNYGELMSQNFPGSNMDAWFQANGVPNDMREYFWSYALGKASSTGTTGGEAILGQGARVPEATQQNPMYQRLAAGNASTRQSFNLGGKLTGMYGNMEQSNRWFNELAGQMVGTVLPGALSSGPLSWMQYMPDEIRDLLMTAAERTSIGTAGAGLLGWGSLFSDEFGSWAKNLGQGDVGDIGYGSMGSTTTAGMHPDMRRKVSAMMRANPNLRINSGHRDLAKQQSLKRRGIGRVSGKPSDHTRGLAADIGPSSQYGWLVQNARKFGLKSGAGAGEPWHVGMGDLPMMQSGGASNLTAQAGGSPLDIVGQITDSKSGIVNMIQQLFSSFGSVLQGGVDPNAQMAGMAKGTTTILKALLTVFANPNADLSSLNFRDVYGGLTGATKAHLASKDSGLPTLAPSGPSAPTHNFRNTGNVSGGFTGPKGSLERALATAQVAHAAGFSGEDLFKIVSIAGRESGGWDPGAVNPTTSDRGLFQMNWDAHHSWLQQTGIASTQDALFMGPDAASTSARAAYELWHNRSKGSWRPWKATSKGWDPNGSELYGTDKYQPTARAAISQLGYGVGDTDFADYGGGNTVTHRTMVFNNTFQVQPNPSSAATGGVDVKRVASALEQQMRQNVSRYN